MPNNGYRMNVNYITRKKMSNRQLRLLTWTSFISQIVHPVGKEGLGKGGGWGIVSLASYKFHFFWSA